MIGPIKPFNSIGEEEMIAAGGAVLMRPLSGYLAGEERGGFYVRALEDAWCETFGVRHAIAVNSATSALLAAAFAADMTFGTHFVCSPMTMSATAAAPMFTGAAPMFVDPDEETFNLSSHDLPYGCPVVTTNLFGQPSDLGRLRKWCDLNKTYLIEDNAQSPFAMEHGKYAGTIGHIGCWSLNIHKSIQCGEGGVCTTDDDELAERMRNFVNHGEHRSDRIGLNLRMPEVCAAIARVQLRRGKEIIAGRVEQAEAIIAAIGDIPGLRPPVVREGCTSVYYAIPFMVEKNRHEFCNTLLANGVPIVEGYVDPLYRMPAFSQFARSCPVAEDLHDRRLMYFENCAWDLTKEQIRQVGEAFKNAAEQWLIDR